eukprot:NODE_6882_length_476_cov_1.862233.p3 GENE.NODE_6882_length_476_cov_1.862233~~NODE_6882_length_476_cov_1.862233.p3  ORF type:complete len:72 (+),score=7.33 NODE_6882_length_476_cov_1.862233:209-424(+)
MLQDVPRLLRVCLLDQRAVTLALFEPVSNFLGHRRPNDRFAFHGITLHPRRVPRLEVKMATYTMTMTTMTR